MLGGPPRAWVSFTSFSLGFISSLSGWTRLGVGGRCEKGRHRKKGRSLTLTLLATEIVYKVRSSSQVHTVLFLPQTPVGGKSHHQQWLGTEGLAWTPAALQ